MKKLFIAFSRFRSSLTRNQIFFMIIFGLVASFGVFYAIYHPTAKENARNETNQPNKESRDYNTAHKKTPPSSRLALEVGKDSVVMGNVPPNTKVGEGSVVIGPTDNKGNTIINTPMAVGRGAKAGPGSIAIGAGAGANSQQDTTPEKEDNK